MIKQIRPKITLNVERLLSLKLGKLSEPPTIAFLRNFRDGVIIVSDECLEHINKFTLNRTTL